MKNKFIYLFSFVGWILAGYFGGNYYNTSTKIDKLQETITRQGLAIESLEKQKNHTEVCIPKYLDSIPDYD